MHMEEPEVRSGVSSPTAVHPRAPAAYAVLAAPLGLLVEFLEHPPTVITVIVVATFFGAMIASEVSLRGRA
jgi:hypothetical protein